jgi:YVTN family beta-propeller protein
MKYLNHLIIFALAAGALLVSFGCNMDPWAYAVGYDPDKENETYYALRCDPQSKVFSLSTVPYGTPGSSDSPISIIGMIGKPCTPSNEGKGRPDTISNPVSTTPGSSGGSLSSPEVPSASASAETATTPPPVRNTTATVPPPPPSLINTFPWLEPLMFPPAFPISDAGKNPLTCVSTLKVYLVNHVEGTVTSTGLCPFRVIKEIPVFSNPLQVAITPDGTLALVTSYDGALTFIDTTTDNIKAVLDLSNYNPSGIAISPDGTRAYVTHYLDQQPCLLVIDIPNVKLLSTIPLSHAYPRVVTLTPDGSQAWVNYYSDRVVTIIDLLTGTVANTVDVSTEADTGIAFDPAGTRAYIAVYPNQIFVYDTASLTRVATITVGTSPMDVVMMPEGNLLFVSTETDAGFWWIDTKTNKQTRFSSDPSASFGGGTMGLVVFH